MNFNKRDSTIFLDKKKVIRRILSIAGISGN
jgi:hypothetical protein